MTLTVETRALADALARATKSVKTRNTIPILDNVMLTQSGEELTITATDKDVRVDVTIACSGKLSPTTAPARRLNDLVRGYPSGSQTTLSLDGEHVVVACGRSRAKLLTLPVDGFPSASSDKFGKPVDLDLRSMVDQVKFAASTAEANIGLNGVRIELRDTLDCVAADGHRMAILRTAKPLGWGLERGRTIPTQAISIIPDGVVVVAFSANKLRIKSGDTIVVSSLIESPFPDYEKHTPTGHATTVSFNVAALAQAVSRLDTMASEIAGKPMRFEAETGRISVETKNPQVGVVTDEIEASANGSVVVGFNTSYLKEILSACISENVSMGVDSKSSVIRDGELTLVQMCQRVAG